MSQDNIWAMMTKPEEPTQREGEKRAQYFARKVAYVQRDFPAWEMRENVAQKIQSIFHTVQLPYGTIPAIFKSRAMFVKFIVSTGKPIETAKEGAETDLAYAVGLDLMVKEGLIESHLHNMLEFVFKYEGRYLAQLIEWFNAECRRQHNVTFAASTVKGEGYIIRLHDKNMCQLFIDINWEQLQASGYVCPHCEHKSDLYDDATDSDDEVTIKRFEREGKQLKPAPLCHKSVPTFGTDVQIAEATLACMLCVALTNLKVLFTEAESHLLPEGPTKFDELKLAYTYKLMADNSFVCLDGEEESLVNDYVEVLDNLGGLAYFHDSLYKEYGVTCGYKKVKWSMVTDDPQKLFNRGFTWQFYIMMV